MPGSGQLGLRMAGGLGVPHATVITVIKALRAGRMLTMKGRGVSAAQMTADDAIAITVGDHVRSRHRRAPGGHKTAAGNAVAALRPRSTVGPSRRACGAGPPHISRRISAPCSKAMNGSETTGSSDAQHETVGQMDGMWVTAAVDGGRKKGFGVIEARDVEGDTWRNFYSTDGAASRGPNSRRSRRCRLEPVQRCTDVRFLLDHRRPRSCCRETCTFRTACTTRQQASFGDFG